jgi:hypothetical protein
MRTLLRSIALVLIAGVAWGARIPPCPAGRFIIDGVPLVPGAPADSIDAFEFTATKMISLDSGCSPVLGQVRGTKKGTKLRAKWPLGCGAVTLVMRIRATIDNATCNVMTGEFRIPKLRLIRPFTAARQTNPTSCTQSTFQTIQQGIFAKRGCTLSTCHGQNASANLDLRPGSALLSTVNVLATNAVAAAAGKRRIVPGDAANSFLSQKVHGTLLPGEGNPMPFIGQPLTQEELDLLDLWIDAGAPPAGSVAGAYCLPPETYVPTAALPPPAGGYQLVLNGPTLQPGQEQEGCLWIPVPNSTDFDVGLWEFALNPGTHHFAIFEYQGTGTPPTPGVWRAGDIGCFSGAEFGNNISGSPQAPYYIDTYPPGVARRLQAGKWLGLNAHYANVFEVPIQIKVWSNLHPYNGTPDHLATSIVDISDMFSINVPPFTQRVQPGRFDNTSGQPYQIFGVGGHMHKRGLRFTAYASDGTKIYEDFDWAHPTVRWFDPPFVLNPGDYINYECLHDNGVTRPVKTDGAGNPISVLFGVTTDDEMCTIVGQFWTD